MQGYEDANDVSHLKNDPLYKDILEGNLASQPTISRFENSLDKHSIFNLCYAWIDRYVLSLKGRSSITIDVDATDDPTYGTQQLSMFNGYYGQFMYNELLFHDGDTGQIIVPVLRPGNSHSNKWYVGILKRIIIKIRQAYPDIEIIIRADSGFSCARFYKLADCYNLKYAVGLSSNAVLKRKISRASKALIPISRYKTPTFYWLHLSGQELAQRTTMLFENRKYGIRNEYPPLCEQYRRERCTRDLLWILCQTRRSQRK